MPIYEFECNKCGHRFDVRMSLSDEPPETCPSKGCRGRLHKVFSPPVIIFKGSGFHVNDYSSTGPKSADKPKVPGKSESGAKSESATKSESKPSGGSDT